MITQLKFVGIPTRDQTRALKFYTEQLGFEVATDQPFDDKQRWIELRIQNASTRVVLFTPEGHESRIGTFFNGSFTCDDVPATYRQLRARGVEFVSGGEAAVGRVRRVQGSGRQSVRAVLAVSDVAESVTSREEFAADRATVPVPDRRRA